MPNKWWIILFLGAILGLPSTAEDPFKENKASSASECRVHIEKALEQYWDQSEPSDPNNPNVDQTINARQQNNDAPEIQDQNENEANDEEEEDIQSKDNSLSDETNHLEDEDENDDDETSENEQDEEDDENSENEAEENTVGEQQVAENDEEEEDQEDAENDEEENEEDEDQEDEVGALKEGSNELNNSKNENSNDTQDDDVINGDDDDNNNDDDIGYDDEDDDEEENDPDFEMKEEIQIEDKTDGSSEDSIANEVVDETEEEEDDDEEEQEVEQDEEAKDSQSELSADEIKIEIQIESDKVIGEADRASAGMDSKFHDEKPSFEQSQATEEKNLSLLTDEEDSELEINDNDDTIENIYEEEEEEASGITYRSRDHIDVILGLDEIATEYDNEEVAQNIFKEIKKIYISQIKPIEMLYKYADSTTRVLGDAEIFTKPLLIFLGPWNSGKTTIINYLLGTERNPNALKTGTGITDTDFTFITYGETYRIRSGTELTADWRYAGLQRFGQDFLDHFRGLEIPHTLLKKITIVDTPGILENKKTAERGYSLSDAFQWFIDRSDAIYVVLDPSKVDIGAELGSVVDQLKGRDARFLLNKADSIRRSDLMRVVGQLFWNLSPLMSSTEAPLIYAVSLTTKPFHPSAPMKFLVDQEKNYFYDMKDTLKKRVENRILYARRHAVRVRNHAKMIDCYLATYYRHKSIFSNKRNVAKSIIENPHNYNLFDGFGGMTNVSRYDLPNPSAYKEFFKLHPLYDFKPLASTCSYFRGCPMDKLDLAISKDIPELLAKYKKTKQTDSLKHNR